MTARPIAYNLVRLVQSAIYSTPRGVDRIDLGYLSYLFETWPGEIFGVLPTAIGVRFFPRELVLRGRTRLMQMWKEQSGIEDDPVYASLSALLAGNDNSSFATLNQAPKKNAGLISPRSMYRIAKVLLGDGIVFGQSILKLPQNSIYLDVGHYGITFPGAFKWRQHRPDVAPVFLIHDTIPLDFPHFVAEETVRAHLRVMKKVARQAQALIVPTASAGEAVRARLKEWNAPQIPIHAVPLPIDDVFLNHVGAPTYDHPYFVICGAIEPRKNHGLLLDVWDTLVQRLGDAAPRLVIAGAPGFRSGEIITRLAGSTHLQKHVILASGLSSPALAQLMAGARALLMPSFAEGFGLPPVEAMSVGTPALVSDIPAHRDANSDWAYYRSTDDKVGWLEDIVWLSDDSPRYAATKQRLKRFKPANWAAYMAEIGRILQQV